MEGIIFKIKRKKQGVSLDYISSAVGITKGELSRFENNKRDLGEDLVNQLFFKLDGTIGLDEKSEQDLIHCVNTLYKSIINQQDLNIAFEDYLNSEWKNARNEYYLVWLIGLLMFCSFLNESSHDYELIEIMHILNDNEHYIPLNVKSVYFSALGHYYELNDHHKSLECFQSAKSSASNSIEEAYALYQIGKHKCFFNDLTEALDCLVSANTIFSNQFCFNASIAVQTELGFAYSKIGLYDKATKILNGCIQLLKTTPGIVGDIKKINSYLLFSFLDKQAYDEIIQRKEEILLIDREKPLFLFCIGYAYYHKNDLVNAKKYMISAWRNRNPQFKQEHELIQAYKLILNGKSFEDYEKKFLNALNDKEDIHGIQFQVFVLENLIYFSKKENKTERVLEYYEKLHNKLRKRN